MTDSSKTTRCGKEWPGKDGKDHKCVLPGGHGLLCRCDCGAGKWMGHPLPDKYRGKKN